MRKRTVKNGMQLVVVALILIILTSFYHDHLSDMFSLSSLAENRIYSLGILMAAATGGFGVVLITLGFVLSSQSRDESVRIMPTFLIISLLFALFFYLLTTSIKNPVKDEQKRLRPGETITI